MIIIDSVLVSDEVVEEQFVCDLTKCKGGCCEDGDAGAPLENKEKDYIKEYADYPSLQFSGTTKRTPPRGGYARSFGLTWRRCQYP